MAKSSTSFGQPGGNPISRGGRPRGLARTLREEIDSYTHMMAAARAEGGSEEAVAGFRALARRLWDIAMRGEDKDSLVAIKIIYERTDGAPRQTVELVDEQPARRIDWSAVPEEKRKEMLRVHEEMRQLAEVVETDEAVEH